MTNQSVTIRGPIVGTVTADGISSTGNITANNGTISAGNLTASGNLGIGTAAPSRKLHVEGSEIHSGGAGAGFSFGNRETTAFVESPSSGERWVWYSSGGVARLWSGGDKLLVDRGGNVFIRGGRTYLQGIDGANNHWIMAGGDQEEVNNALGLSFTGSNNCIKTGPGWQIGVGTAAPSRKLHVEGVNSEIHSGGAGAGFSFGNRETTAFVESPSSGERWVWYSSGGMARLWSGGDKLSVDKAGNVGIGLTQPLVQLHVRGGIATGLDSISPGSITLFPSGDTSGGIIINHSPFHIDNYNRNQTFPFFTSVSVLRFSRGANPGDNVIMSLLPNYVDIPGDLYVSGQKHFVQDHPTDPTKEIVYTTLEGGEAGTYIRGTAALVKGRAVIELPEHFGHVTSEEGLTIQLTPHDEWLQLYVVQLTTRQLIVQEAQEKSARFDYLLQGVRKGYEHHEVIQPRRGL